MNDRVQQSSLVEVDTILRVQVGFKGGIAFFCRKIGDCADWCECIEQEHGKSLKTIEYLSAEKMFSKGGRVSSFQVVAPQNKLRHTD